MEIIKTGKQTYQPKITKYTDVLVFLNDYYHYLRSLDSKFNYDQWSALLGFKSRTFMNLICTGRRNITPLAIERLNHFFKFNNEEKTYFSLIANLKQAETTEIETIFKDKVLELFEHDERRLENEDFLAFTKSKTMPVICVLLAFPDFDGTKEEILKYLKISLKNLESDLSTLEQMGLICQSVNLHGAAVWRSNQKAFKFPDKNNQLILKQYHSTTLSEAIEVNETRTKTEFNNFRSILFGVPSERQDELKSEIECFLNKIKHKYGTETITNNKLVKLNLQTYTVID